jgi:peroxiredoxin
MATRLIWSNDTSDQLTPPAGRASAPADALSLNRRAVRAGAKAPDFRLRDQHGRHRMLKALLQRGAVVLKFCRNENTEICVREFVSLSALHSDVKRLGTTLVVIAVEPFDPRPLGKDATSFPFPILRDVDGDVALSYGLAYSAAAQVASGTGNDDNGPKTGREILSAPATYVIDRAGIIALAFIDLECRSLMDHGHILMAVQCLSKRK